MFTNLKYFSLYHFPLPQIDITVLDISRLDKQDFFYIL